jgi:CheY-like chemotaxis protein
MLQEIKQFFDGLGWLANMLALGPVVAAVLGIYTKRKTIMGWFKKRKYLSVADHLQTHLTGYSFKTAEVKLAIVDDTPEDFPLEYLKNTFGRVDVFEKISLSEASRLVGYDLVFLDMMGVVKEDNKYGGLQLIRKIKELPDAPTVVAVSGARFDATATEYFRAADDVMKKPLTEIKCEEIVLDLLKEKTSPHKSADTIDGELMAKSKNERERGKALGLVIKYLDRTLTVEQFRAELLEHFRHIDTALVVAKATRIRDSYAP